MGKYRFLLFDADNTLLDFTRSEHEAVGETFEFFGLPKTDEYIRVYSEINDMYWKMLERGEIPKKELFYKRFDTFCEKYGFAVDGRDLAREYMIRLSTKSYLYEGASELCRILSERGRYDMYIITNGDKRVQEARFDTCPIAKYFKAVFISEVVGFEKPSISYFEAVEREIPGFDKSLALVIGDSLSSDIAGGINAEIDTCWFNPKGKVAPSEIADRITYTVGRLADVANIV